MEEDQDYASIASDVVIKAKEILSSDDMDFSTKQSQLVANMLSKVSFDDPDEFAFFRWYFEVTAWIQLKFADTNFNNSRTICPVKRDDRLTTLACYAAFVSMRNILINIVPNVSYRNVNDKGKRIKAIQEEVLDSFNFLCENLLIDKSLDVVGIRETIVEAADFAIDYINSIPMGKLRFPGNYKHHAFLLSAFKSFLIGNFEQEEGLSNPSTHVMDDGLVGLSVEIQKIKERLTGSNSNLEIIPVIGIGGIGKTTLAKKVYNDPQIKHLFLVHAWIVVSKEFHERDVYLGLLESIAPLPDEVYKEDTEQLAIRLYRRLKGLRYLIVIDDIWTKEAWDCIKLCFPNDNNGSRIILTSRIKEMASHVNHENPPHFMSFLRIEESWELLNERVFGKEVCPYHLRNIGIQLAEKCQGLSLAIEMMAGHLSNISKTQECWEEVTKRVDFPTEVTQLESLSKILFISLHDLPHQLKKCFISMTLFPKNFEIPVRKLIQMWTAMGFLSQNFQDSESDVTLEEVAMSCLESLINRSLIVVKHKKFNSKPKLCGVHDVLWDLSMREFSEQFSCDDDQKYAIQSLFYLGYSFESDYSINIEGFKDLRVLDIPNQYFEHFPIVITDLGSLRYLALSTSDNIPHLIYRLSYLETLLNYHERAGQVLPDEIWLLANLKYLHIGTCTLLCKPSNLCVEGSSNSLLPCLWSLYNLSLASTSNELFSNIPNLKQLGIVEHEEDDVGDELLCCALKNITSLTQLEKFKLYCSFSIKRPRCIPDWGDFLPNTIKKLTLSQSHLEWSKMKTLATLPNLEVLKLKVNAFQGDEWVMDDEEFLNLKYLLLESLDLVFWKANNDNLPNLQHLASKFCGCLCEIPREFRDIYTLELIDLEFVCNSVCASAIEIQREQKILGNDKFNLRLGDAPLKVGRLKFKSTEEN